MMSILQILNAKTRKARPQSRACLSWQYQLVVYVVELLLGFAFGIVITIS
ncbi:MAG TPA: hypothetical protein VIV62_07780 [Chthoniobacterales bacterium]|jgi:hypothetical protein